MMRKQKSQSMYMVRFKACCVIRCCLILQRISVLCKRIKIQDYELITS